MPVTENFENKKVLVRDYLFTVPKSKSEKPQLIGISCNSCGETVFPINIRCPNCSSDDVHEVLIGPLGKLYSFTIIYQPAPIGYKGPTPYGIVKVEMPEGLRVTGYCTVNDPAHLRVGMEMELVIDKLFTDTNNNDVIGFKFKPARLNE